MRRNHVLALLFVLACLSAALALTLVVPPASDVYGEWNLDNPLSRLAPAVAWDKHVRLNGDLALPGALSVEAGDTIEIVDRVWLTHTEVLSFDLVEAWSESLSLTDCEISIGRTVSVPGWLEWNVEGAMPGAWHVMTKTFEVLPGAWQTDRITETLDVELVGEEQRVISLDYQAASFYLTKAVEPLNQVPTAVVTYTLAWGNEGGLAPGVIITDALPDQVVFVDADPAAAYDPLSHELTWGPFDLDTGDGMEATVRATVAPGVLPNVWMTNTAHLLYAGLPPLVAQVTHHVLAPCTDIEDVTLTWQQSTVYPHDAIQLQVDILPDDADKPYRYRLVLDGVEQPPVSASDDPLSLAVTFDTLGEHTLTFGAWNCAMSLLQAVSDTLDMVVIPHQVYLPLVGRNF